MTTCGNALSRTEWNRLISLGPSRFFKISFYFISVKSLTEGHTEVFVEECLCLCHTWDFSPLFHTFLPFSCAVCSVAESPL